MKHTEKGLSKCSIASQRAKVFFNSEKIQYVVNCFDSPKLLWVSILALGGARGVMVIVVGQWTRRHEFKSWTRLIAFHIALIPLGKV